jgi:hypothetical protein
VKSSAFKVALFSILVLLLLAAAAGYAWAENLPPSPSDILTQNAKLSQKLQ